MSAAKAEIPQKTRRVVDIARQTIPVGVRAEEASSSSSMARYYRRHAEQVLLFFGKSR